MWERENDFILFFFFLIPWFSEALKRQVCQQEKLGGGVVWQSLILKFNYQEDLQRQKHGIYGMILAVRKDELGEEVGWGKH